MIVPLDLGGRLWINLESDRTVGMSFSLNAIEFDPVVSVSTKPNALGEQWAVRTPGKQQVAKVTLNFCTDDQQAFLAEHQGDVCWFRSDIGAGYRFAGIYADSTFTPRPIGNSWAVPFTVQQITIDESV
jgi:hypothetical protein